MTKIDGGAFVDSGIKSIDLSGITEFGYDDDTDYADYGYDEGYIFSNCKDLASVTLGDSLEVLPSGTFRGCASLTQIIIPDSVTTIDVGCFYGSGLEQVYLSENVEEIDRAFQSFERQDWTENALVHSPKWERVRETAANVLKLTGEKAEPPHLFWIRDIFWRQCMKPHGDGGHHD